jgi:hypothetical protein
MGPPGLLSYWWLLGTGSGLKLILVALYFLEKNAQIITLPRRNGNNGLEESSKWTVADDPSDSTGGESLGCHIARYCYTPSQSRRRQLQIGGVGETSSVISVPGSSSSQEWICCGAIYAAHLKGFYSPERRQGDSLPCAPWSSEADGQCNKLRRSGPCQVWELG